MSNLHPKILELKKRAAAINYGSVSVNEIGELQERESLLDQRIVEGYAIIWGQRNLHGEIFKKGAFAKSIRERGPGSGSNYEIKFLYNHDTDEPLSLFAELREDDKGLYFRTRPLDAVPTADRTLVQLKSRTLNNFSQGFDFIFEAGKIEYDERTDSVVISEAVLYEISVATIPSGMDTYVIRSMDNMEELHDEIECFIKSLPRNYQLAAREKFALQKNSLQKSLTDCEPLEQRTKALKEISEPVEKSGGLNYQYLLNNLK